jgi:hypothetical protein
MEFAKWGLSVERFAAVDGEQINPFPYNMRRGSIGNCLSKLGVLALAKERGYKSVLILEDDVEFQDDFNNKFSEWSKEVPSNWDMLWIGGNHNWVRDIPLYSPHLIRITNTYATHAFALRDTIYDRVIEALSPLEPEDDIILAGIQKECEAFCFMPNLAYQRAGVSDVFNREVYYEFLKTGRW